MKREKCSPDTFSFFQRLPEEAAGLSLHGGGLAEVLALARELGELPPLVLYGVEPERVGIGMGLSPPVVAALEELLARVRGEVAAWPFCIGRLA